MSRAKKSPKKLTPSEQYKLNHREEMLRKHRQTIYLNDREMAAISAYCSRFQV